VTGIDFAEKSIRHARQSARNDGLTINYRHESFLTADLGGPYDLITMIYGEFCTLTEMDRHELLLRVKQALRPGGLFAFDVFTQRYVERLRGCGDFYVSTGNGFWQRKPHIVIEQVFHYPAASASVSRYTLVNRNGSYRQFLVWWRSFSGSEIARLLTDYGFTVEAAYGSLWGDETKESDEWIGIYART
jgi:SAM-dependent methyltransferase